MVSFRVSTNGVKPLTGCYPAVFNGTFIFGLTSRQWSNIDIVHYFYQANVQLSEAVLKKCAIIPMGNAGTIALKFGGNSWKGSRRRASPAWQR
jgi:hypothetical protein